MDHFKKHLIQRVPFSETTRNTSVTCEQRAGIRCSQAIVKKQEEAPRSLAKARFKRQTRIFCKAEEAKKSPPPAEVAEEAWHEQA